MSLLTVVSDSTQIASRRVGHGALSRPYVLDSSNLSRILCALVLLPAMACFLQNRYTSLWTIRISGSGPQVFCQVTTSLRVSAESVSHRLFPKVDHYFQPTQQGATRFLLHYLLFFLVYNPGFC